MMYRVIRDLGPSDYVVGAVFDGAAISPVRLRQLVEQNRIEPVMEPGSEHAALLSLAQQLAALEAKVAALEAAQTAAPSTEDDALPDLGKLKADELKALAAERGIEGAASMTKAELVAALAAQEGAPDA